MALLSSPPSDGRGLNNGCEVGASKRGVPTCRYIVCSLVNAFRSAKIAPIRIASWEGKDSLALPSQAQIRVNNRERPLFRELLKNSRRKNLNAGEG